MWDLNRSTPALDKPNELCRGGPQGAAVEQIEHAVLDDLGERDQIGELAAVEPREYRVRDVADSRL